SQAMVKTVKTVKNLVTVKLKPQVAATKAKTPKNQAMVTTVKTLKNQAMVKLKPLVMATKVKIPKSQRMVKTEKIPKSQAMVTTVKTLKNQVTVKLKPLVMATPSTPSLNLSTPQRTPPNRAQFQPCKLSDSSSTLSTLAKTKMLNKTSSKLTRPTT